MKKFVDPTIEVLLLNVTDILTTSTDDLDWDTYETE